MLQVKIKLRLKFYNLGCFLFGLNFIFCFSTLIIINHTPKNRKQKYNQNSLACMFVFPIEVSGEFDSSFYQKLCTHMHDNNQKFERNSSLSIIT